MLIVSKEYADYFLKYIFTTHLFDVNKSIYQTGQPGRSANQCIRLGGALSEEERQECYKEVKAMLMKEGIVFGDIEP